MAAAARRGIGSSDVDCRQSRAYDEDAAVSRLDAFPALRVAPYRRLLFALTAGQTGLHAFETTLFWTAFEQTGSAVLVSLLLVGLVVPVLILTVPVGMVVDRFGPRRLLLPATASAAGVVALAAIVTAGIGLSFEATLILALLEGGFFACWAIPAQVLGSRVVDRTQMPSAIGLSMLPSGIGSMLGGLGGGTILQVFGPVPAIALAAAGLTVAVIAIAGLPDLPGYGAAAGGTRLRGQLGDAAGWIRQTPVALAVVGLGAAAGFFAMSRFGLTPVLVRDVLDAGPAGLGLMTMAGGLGSILGTSMTDAAGRRLRRGPVLLSALAVSGLALMALGVAPHLAIALGFAALITCTLIIYQVTAMTVLQVLAPPRMRGRTLALYDLVRLGLVPPGSLSAGLLVGTIGVSGVFLAFGGMVVLAVVLIAFLARPLVDLDLDAALIQTDLVPAEPAVD